MYFFLHLMALLLPFNWDQVLTMPASGEILEGNQILHFKSSNKVPTAETLEFIKNNFKTAKILHADSEVLKCAIDSVTLEGMYLELGACTGKTINFIAALNPLKKIYGFDSFQGLPEDWVRGDKNFAKETFSFRKEATLPPVLHNVVLIPGWFENSLQFFKRTEIKNEKIAFLHIDCDIYSSTATAFNHLKHNIVPGTVIVFDEYYNYPGFENHEYKAFQEFLSSSNLKAECIAYNAEHEQVAMKIINK